jgi:hypothetical protein
MITRVYPVADLIVPIDNLVIAPTEKGTKKTPGGGKTQEEKLMKLIESTVCPHSWASVGGTGQVEFFPPTMSLVVHQTPDAHEMIEELFSNLRKVHDLEVSTEMRFVTVSVDMIEKLGLKEKEGVVLLDDTQLRVLLDTVQQDKHTNVMQAPKLTMFNGQQATINLMEKQAFVVGVDFEEKDGKRMPTPRTKSVSTGMHISVLPTISPDRKAVSMQVGIKIARADAHALNAAGVWTKRAISTSESDGEPRYSTLEVEKTVKLTSGTTALLTGWTQMREVRNEVCPPVLSKIPYLSRIFRTVSYGKEMEQTFVLVTPRVIARPEAEQAVPQQVGSAEACESPAQSEVMHVNKRSFELTYQVENIEPSKMKSIEVWWTHGHGKWERYPEEVKPSGPIPIKVRGEGRWGFYLIPRSRAGKAVDAPKPGEAAHVWVQVDETPPTVEVYKPETGLTLQVGLGVNSAAGLAGVIANDTFILGTSLSGSTKSETIVFRWSARDAHLRSNPVSLFWSHSPNGPWRVLAQDLENTGKWECDRSLVPDEFHLRVTVSDMAGNVGEATTSDPIVIDQRVPVIRNVKVNVHR